MHIPPPASKKILTLGAKGDPPPHPKALQLQKMIRYSATLFVQVREEERHRYYKYSPCTQAVVYFRTLMEQIGPRLQVE